MNLFGFSVTRQKTVDNCVQGQILRLDANPGDIFVLQCERRLTDDEAKRIRDLWDSTMAGKDAKLAVISPGMKLGRSELSED